MARLKIKPADLGIDDTDAVAKALRLGSHRLAPKENAIRRKYSELTVRKFARERGFSVASNDGNKIKLINRRA